MILLDDQLARQTARAKGPEVWGTLRLLIEAKTHGIVDRIAALVDQLAASGMWLSEDVRKRILALAGEQESDDARADTCPSGTVISPRGRGAGEAPLPFTEHLAYSSAARAG